MVRKPGAGLIAGVVLLLTVAGCSTGGGDDSAGWADAQSADWGGGSWDEEDSGSVAGCYGHVRSGCSEISWQDVEAAVNALYALYPEYQGYTREDAIALARTLYDNGTYPGSWLRVLVVQAAKAGQIRAYVAVTTPDGQPAMGLGPAAFQISTDGGEPISPVRATRLGDLAATDNPAEMSVVIDDSGSIQDCDANFLADGLGYLFIASRTWCTLLGDFRIGAEPVDGHSLRFVYEQQG